LVHVYECTDPVLPIRARDARGQGAVLNPVLFLSLLHQIGEVVTIFDRTRR